MTNVTRDMLVAKLFSFELSEFGDPLPKIESAFKAIVSGKKRYNLKEIYTRISRYEKDMEDEEKEHEELEALIARRLPKGVNKYEGKLPLKCFSCNKIGHFASRCLERDRNPKKPYKPYEPKYQKKCYYAANEGVADDESDKENSGDEFMFCRFPNQQSSSSRGIVTNSSTNSKNDLAN